MFDVTFTHLSRLESQTRFLTVTHQYLGLVTRLCRSTSEDSWWKNHLVRPRQWFPHLQNQFQFLKRLESATLSIWVYAFHKGLASSRLLHFLGRLVDTTKKSIFDWDLSTEKNEEKFFKTSFFSDNAKKSGRHQNSFQKVGIYFQTLCFFPSFFFLVPISICLRALCSIVIRRYTWTLQQEEWMRHENNDVGCLLPSKTFKKIHAKNKVVPSKFSL